jgi:Skp family chaperone for outer membrane proteins
MSDSRLHTLLEELREELQRTQALEAGERERLNQLVRDLQKELAAETQDRDESLLGRLDAAIKQFEVSHPTLTRALSQLFNSLSQGGV